MKASSIIARRKSGNKDRSSLLASWSFLILSISIAAFLTNTYARITVSRQGQKLYLTGDSELIGSDVLVDNQKVGVMEKIVDSKTGKQSSSGVGIGFFEGTREPEYVVYDQIRVRPGKHRMVFVTENGRRLWRGFEMPNSENYIGVSSNDLPEE